MQAYVLFLREITVLCPHSEAHTRKMHKLVFAISHDVYLQDTPINLSVRKGSNCKFMYMIS